MPPKFTALGLPTLTPPPPTFAPLTCAPSFTVAPYAPFVNTFANAVAAAVAAICTIILFNCSITIFPNSFQLNLPFSSTVSNKYSKGILV